MLSDWIGLALLLGTGVIIIVSQRFLKKWAKEGKVKGFDPITGAVSPFYAARDLNNDVKNGRGLHASPVLLLAGALQIVLGCAFVFFLSPQTIEQLLAGGGFLILGILFLYMYWKLSRTRALGKDRAAGLMILGSFLIAIAMLAPYLIRKTYSEADWWTIASFIFLLISSTIFIGFKRSGR